MLSKDDRRREFSLFFFQKKTTEEGVEASSFVVIVVRGYRLRSFFPFLLLPVLFSFTCYPFIRRRKIFIHCHFTFCNTKKEGRQ